MKTNKLILTFAALASAITTTALTSCSTPC